MKVLKDLMPGLQGDEDPGPINKEEAAIGSLESLKSAVNSRHLLGWVILVQVTEPVTIADCLQDGLVLFITFGNVYQLEYLRVENDASGDNFDATLVEGCVLVVARLIFDISSGVQAGGAAQVICHDILPVGDMFNYDVIPDHFF